MDTQLESLACFGLPVVRVAVPGLSVTVDCSAGSRPPKRIIGFICPSEFRMSPSPRPADSISTGPPNKAFGHELRKVTYLQFQALGLKFIYSTYSTSVPR